MSNDKSPDSGEATLLVPVSKLVETILLLPEIYHIIGSRESNDGKTIALRVKSKDIYGDKMIVAPEIYNKGSTKIMSIVPIGRNS